MNLSFRKMFSDDLETVKKLDKLAFSNPWPENAIKYELEQNSNARLWVSELGEPNQRLIVSFAIVWVILDEAHIGSIAILPEFQNLGIGQKFLAFISLQLLEENIKKIFLEVRKSNVTAIALYEKLGFTMDGERKRYYSDNGESALLMSSPMRNPEYYKDIMEKCVNQSGQINKEVIS